MEPQQLCAIEPKGPMKPQGSINPRRATCQLVSTGSNGTTCIGFKRPLGPLRGQGGPDMIDHQNRFYGLFSKRGVRPTSCFLPDQKISILAEVIAGQRSASMCNSIVRAIFIRVYLKN